VSEITKEMIKELREKSGAGLVDCKNALKETAGDIEAAIKHLREKGLSQASKKASRAASDGKVSISVSADNKYAAIYELNCETDFVTKTDDFQTMIRIFDAMAMSAKSKSLDEFLNLSVPENGSKASDWISEKISVIGENIVLKRFEYLDAGNNGTVAVYTHGEGKIGVLLAAEVGNQATLNNETFSQLLKDICMHIAAASPLYLDSSSVDAQELQKEREIYRKQVLDQGKPENMLDKIVEGKLRKYYEEVCLVDQEYIRENKIKIHEVIKQKEKELKDTVKLKKFIRFALGG
jgi:elongation factor Ts